MPDGLTAHTPPPTHEPLESEPEGAPRSPWLVALLQALGIVVVFGVVGVGCGWLWYHVWDAPSGVVANHQWFTNEAGLRADFNGVAWYVTIALVAGLVLGVLAALLCTRSELVTLAAVVVGSALAAVLMLRVGTHLSPGDPHELAKTAQDGAKLKGALHVDPWPARAAFPFGALLGLAFVYLLSSGRPPREPRTDDTAQPGEPDAPHAGPAPQR